jgi:hypothetical protein
MRKTFSNDDHTGFIAGVPRLRRFALTAAVTLLVGTLAAGCGNAEKDAERDAKLAKRAESKAAGTNVDGSSATPPANAADKQSRRAEAVVDSKTTAPVDMQYELLAKPALGQPFEVELAFTTRLPAAALDIEVNEAPGLTVVGQKTARFEMVESGQVYTTKVLVQGDTAGLYYLGVMAKMSTQVQTETRVFAVPVVIGSPPAAQKANPPKDASGQAIQSMPAKEPN